MMVQMVRSTYTAALLITFVLATGFFYVQYRAMCSLPLTYAVSAVDSRFAIDEPAAAAAVAEAAAVWETALQQDIFVPVSLADDPDVLVNFVYDERQVRTDAEARERERLAVVEALSGEVQSAYESMSQELSLREAAYEQAAAKYERALSAYNTTVATYNADGGAPPEVYQELEQEAAQLKQEAERLANEVVAINALIDKLNQLGADANTIISRFNERVDNFNLTFADGREFTQGDYGNGVVSIYSFTDVAELHVVLVHELGHTLSLEHVDDETAYMYFLLGEQSAEQPLQPADVAAFHAQCSPAARVATLPQPWRSLFAWLGVS